MKYNVPVDWISFNRTKPVMVVHGAQREEKKALMKEASVYPQMSLCQVGK